jgi:hypothetical protein
MTPTFANAQAVLVNYLRPALAALVDPVLSGLIVGTTVPPLRDSGSPPLLVVRRSGGVAEPPVLDRPRLDFLCWSTTEFKATAIANITRGLLLYDLPGRVVDGFTCYQPVEFSGPLPYPDPAGSAVPICMFTIEVKIRVL